MGLVAAAGRGGKRYVNAARSNVVHVLLCNLCYTILRSVSSAIFSVDFTVRANVPLVVTLSLFAKHPGAEAEWMTRGGSRKQTLTTAAYATRTIDLGTAATLRQDQRDYVRETCPPK